MRFRCDTDLFDYTPISVITLWRITRTNGPGKSSRRYDPYFSIPFSVRVGLSNLSCDSTYDQIKFSHKTHQISWLKHVAVAPTPPLQMLFNILERHRRGTGGTAADPGFSGGGMKVEIGPVGV